MKKFSITIFGIISLLTIGAGCFTKTVTVNVSTGSNANAIENINAQQTISVKLSINYGNASPVRTFDSTMKQGSTALALLDKVAAANNISVEKKEFSFGTQVTGINKVEQTEKKFWTFYVNDKVANVGAGSYTLADGDTIMFRLEAGQ